MTGPTEHRIYCGNASRMDDLGIKDDSVDLIVTSPPYPMIGMWDEVFNSFDPSIQDNLRKGDGEKAFELMNIILDQVWKECYRVLKEGGILCINIGDATRTIEKKFQLYSSHSRILSFCISLGFNNLPNIIWRKTTNSPNKFMGSGMLPAGAYVTLEHEYILILRKGRKREFKLPAEKENRQESAFFWEERNAWFSDVWTDLRGTVQSLNHKELRERSAAFPFELAYRLINMFSVKGDTVLDPFLGTGTTTLTAMASERNSLGVEVENNFVDLIDSSIKNIKDFSNNYILNRLASHCAFVENRRLEGKDFTKENIHYHFPVVSGQETKILFRVIKDINKVNGGYKVSYEVPEVKSFRAAPVKKEKYKPAEIDNAQDLFNSEG